MGCAACSSHQNQIGSEDASPQLAFSAEFEGPAGTLLDDATWEKELGRNPDEPSQLEYNTNRAENVSLDGAGSLAITLRKESYKGSDYTSARLTTEFRHELQYGRFESRMQLPEGQGLVAQFFLLGADYPTVDWPACGEVNIFDYTGNTPSVVTARAHGPGYAPISPLDKAFSLQAGSFSGDYHVFAVDWQPELLSWSVDGQEFARVTPQDLPKNGVWVFQHPFFIVIDLALGGALAGPPDDTTPYPSELKVDYVRVYQP